MKRHKNILIIANALITPASIGGGDRFSIEIISRLTDYNINVITPKVGYSHWVKTNNKRIIYHILPQTIFDGDQEAPAVFLAYFFRSLQTIPILKKLSRPDVIISASEFISDVFPCYWYKKRHPDVLWVSRFFHLVPPPYKRKGELLVNIGAYLLQKLSLNILRFSDVLLLDNPYLVCDLTKQGISKEKLAVNFGGVDIKKIRHYKTPNAEKFAAVSVGGVSEHKGTFDLIPVWKKVISVVPQAKLAIVGSGPKSIRKKLALEIRTNHLGKNIKILGYLPHQKGKQMPLFDVLKNSKILLFPDHEAGFGLVVIEAMACGLPVIAYNLPIFGTIFKKGYLTSPLRDTNRFAEQIIKLTKNHALYRQLAKEAYQQAQQYDWRQATTKFRRLLDKLLGNEKH